MGLLRSLLVKKIVYKIIFAYVPNLRKLRGKQKNGSHRQLKRCPMTVRPEKGAAGRNVTLKTFCLRAHRGVVWKSVLRRCIKKRLKTSINDVIRHRFIFCHASVEMAL